MKYSYHGNPRALIINGKLIYIVQSYYICNNEECSNREQIVARHPEILYKKKYSRSEFVRIINLRYNKKYTTKQLLEEVPYISKSVIREMIQSFRAAHRAGADDRIAKKFPPGTKLRLSIDGMEPEKGQPAIYTVRETKEGTLLAADFLEIADAESLYKLVSQIESKYGIIIVGFISDKQTNIISMHDRYYPTVPHQYCAVHFMKNVTQDLRDGDQALLKNLRSEVRSLAVFKTINGKNKEEDPHLAANERFVLAETKKALLALVNLKKKEMFDLAGLFLFGKLTDATQFLIEVTSDSQFLDSSEKFQTLENHISSKLSDILSKYKEEYDFYSYANEIIHPMFNAVMKSNPKSPKRKFEQVIKKWKTQINEPDCSPKLKGLLERSLGFAQSYERGLFIWRKAKLPQTNNDTETFYNQKKGDYRGISRNKQIGVTLELTGLEEMYIPRTLTETEIREDFKVFGNDAYWSIRGEMSQRSAKRKFGRDCRENIVDVLEKIFINLKDK